MNKEYALETAKKIIAKNPELILCGSLSLILSKRIPERDIHDLDFCCHIENFNKNKFIKMCNYGPSEYDGYSCYSVNSDSFMRSSLYYNVFVHEKKVRTQRTSHGFLTQNIDDILEYKKKFNREKDIADLNFL